MRLNSISTAAAALVLAGAALQAQRGTIYRSGAGGIGIGRNDTPRSVIGVTTSGGVSSRDTLGVLVSSLVWGSLVATAAAGGITARRREPVL